MRSSLKILVALTLLIAAIASAPHAGAAEKTLEERIAAMLVVHLGVEPEQIKPAARFKEDLRADELDMTEVAMAAESEFGVVIPDDEVKRMVRVDDLTRSVRSKLPK
jgi:acyl carrier protein